MEVGRETNQGEIQRRMEVEIEKDRPRGVEMEVGMLTAHGGMKADRQRGDRGK